MMNDERETVPPPSIAAGSLLNSGRLVIVVIVLLGIGLGCFGVWYRSQGARRAIAFWGPDTARLMIAAPQAELLWLVDGGTVTASDVLEVNGRLVRVLKRRPVGGAGGFNLVRRALVEDASFDWDVDQSACQPRWTHALVFSADAQRTTILLDLDCPRTAVLGRPQTASIAPFAAGLRAFIADQDSAPAGRRT